jgi:hypothetical protein
MLPQSHRFDTRVSRCGMWGFPAVCIIPQMLHIHLHLNITLTRKERKRAKPGNLQTQYSFVCQEHWTDTAAPKLAGYCADVNTATHCSYSSHVTSVPRRLSDKFADEQNTKTRGSGLQFIAWSRALNICRILTSLLLYISYFQAVFKLQTLLVTWAKGNVVLVHAMKAHWASRNTFQVNELALEQLCPVSKIPPQLHTNWSTIDALKSR